jgi:hypothetical protein
MRSLVMSDVETNSQWAHLLGRAMAGPLTGKTLEPIISEMVTWKQWKEKHPDTSVLNLSRTSERYSAEFRRDPTRFVYGFKVNGKPWALPLDQMVGRTMLDFEVDDQRLLATFDPVGNVTRLFDPVIDDRPLDFERIDADTIRDRQTRSRWDISRGEAVAGPLRGQSLPAYLGIMSYRKAWFDFHPDSGEVSAPK